jgi:hypothetical protein
MLALDVEKISKARKAYTDRQAAGWTMEEALRNTRQEFDLHATEEAAMLSERGSK